MIQTLRQIKTRIRSVENISKMTWAMEMVSASKLRSVQRALAAAKAYHAKVEALLGGLLASYKDARHPFLGERAGDNRSVLCVIASDTGLCGGYNNAVMAKSLDFIGKRPEGSVSLIVVGKRGVNYFEKRGLGIACSYAELYGRYSDVKAREIAARLVEMFVKGEAGEVYMTYTSMVSVSRHEVVVGKLLGVQAPSGGKEAEYITEPSADAIIAKLLSAYVESKVRCALLGAFAAEHSARVIAMSEATNNAKELLDGLVLTRNKTRQANITREIIEVISASDALKG